MHGGGIPAGGSGLQSAQQTQKQTARLEGGGRISQGPGGRLHGCLRSGLLLLDSGAVSGPASDWGSLLHFTAGFYF